MNEKEAFSLKASGSECMWEEPERGKRRGNDSYNLKHINIIFKKMCIEKEKSHSTQTEVLTFKTLNFLLGLERGGCSSYLPSRDTEIHACMPAAMTQQAHVCNACGYLPSLLG